MDPRQKSRLMRIGCLLLLAGFTALLWYYAGKPMIAFVSDPAAFRLWLDERGAWGRIAFVGMVVFQILIAVIPGEPFEVAAGYAFGALEGTALCLAACAIGSMLVFALVRLCGKKLVHIFFSEEQLANLRFLRANPRRDMLLLLIYMIPGTPKDLLGYFAGLTDIRWPAWLLICTLGRIPSIITSTLGGNALGKQSYTAAAVIFALTLAVSAAGLWMYQRICKRHNRS